MGGRGTFAAGREVEYLWETIDKIDGVKVLKNIDKQHKLPEESHSSSAYIRLNHDGSFKEMRFYDKDHYLIHEIAYHPEPNINNRNRREPVLHLHNYNRKFKRTDAVRIHKNSALYRKIKPYLKDIKI